MSQLTKSQLTKKARNLFPCLNNMHPTKHVVKAKKRLDAALTDTVGIRDLNHPKVKELSQSVDYALTIISNG